MREFINMPKHLLVISSTPSSREGDLVLLDRKFVEGMRYYASEWEGPVTCLLPETEKPSTFSETYAADTLPFSIRQRSYGSSINAADLRGADIILASGDDYDCLNIVPLAHRVGQKIVYIIENIPETRRKITMLDQSQSRLKMWRSLVWQHKTERQRRRAFSQADGLQANGYPAWNLYAKFNKNPILYLDNRNKIDILATTEDMEVRKKRLLGDTPLQLIHSGRLEPLKGSYDLLTVARGLSARGIKFNLHVFGSGSLEQKMRSEAEASGLLDQLHFHGVVDFETELMPYGAKNSDLFLCCHLQADPSCTYLENFGCGIPIVGYDNKMWAALCEDSQAGWVTQSGNPQALSDAIFKLSQNRTDIINASLNARRFANKHLFEGVFHKRMMHLKSCLEVAAAR